MWSAKYQKLLTEKWMKFDGHDVAGDKRNHDDGKCNNNEHFHLTPTKANFSASYAASKHI